MRPLLSLHRVSQPQLTRAPRPPAAELDELISVPPDSSLESLDYALRNYIAFASTFMGTSSSPRRRRRCALKR